MWRKSCTFAPPPSCDLDKTHRYEKKRSGKMNESRHKLEQDAAPAVMHVCVCVLAEAQKKNTCTDR